MLEERFTLLIDNYADVKRNRKKGMAFSSTLLKWQLWRNSKRRG